MAKARLTWMSICLSGPSPELTNRCATPAGATTTSPAPAIAQPRRFLAPFMRNVASQAIVSSASPYSL